MAKKTAKKAAKKASSKEKAAKRKQSVEEIEQRAELQRRMELMQKYEPLRRDLRRFVEGAYIFKHPLLCTTLSDGMEHCALLHSILDARIEMVEKFYAEGDVKSALFMHEIAYLTETFKTFVREGRFDGADKDALFWECVGLVYSESEELWSNRKMFLDIFRGDRPGKEHLMREEERAALAELPEQLTIWRGYVHGRRKGLSWTIDRDKAVWFAERYAFGPEQRHIAEGTVAKADIFAYLTRREESEVIVDPDLVKIKKAPAVMKSRRK